MSPAGGNRRGGGAGALAALALATLTAILTAGGPEPASAQSGARPQVLMIAGGGFVQRDGRFEARTRRFAVRAGMRPHYMFPVGRLGAVVRRARQRVRRMRARHGRGRVLAYGTSTGGVVAAILAGDGLVRAAVAKAPAPNLVRWRWPLRAYGGNYFRRIGAGPGRRRALSPLFRPARRPLLVVQGRDDRVVHPRATRRFAGAKRRVRLIMVPGGHQTERSRPWVMRRAMRWLARRAAAGS